MSDPLALLQKYFFNNELALNYIIAHSNSVARLAEIVAENNQHLGVDVQFVTEAAILHDIGIVFCNAPSIGCYGDQPYLKHGILGAEILRKEGFPAHADVCERHIGIGITAAEIEEKKLPLPISDMLPLSHEEKIVCVADKFFSKNELYLTTPKSFDLIFQEMGKLGKRQQLQFEEYYYLYNFEKAVHLYSNVV